MTGFAYSVSSRVMYIVAGTLRQRTTIAAPRPMTMPFLNSNQRPFGSAAVINVWVKSAIVGVPSTREGVVSTCDRCVEAGVTLPTQQFSGLSPLSDVWTSLMEIIEHHRIVVN